ncbi:MAG TPA: hypothetical protein VMX55_00040 [candidate division Zixibacteria bacterium]|nr:hypothetical protein [candidate division Zixibacteria bacterium]
MKINKQLKIPLVLFVSMLCTLTIFPYSEINSSEENEWVEYRIYNPDFLEKQKTNYLTIQSWETWESPVGDSDDASFRYWFIKYEAWIKDVQAIGLKEIGNNRVYISYIKFYLKQGNHYWTDWVAKIQCDWPSMYPNDADTTGEFVIDAPPTYYNIYSHNWQQYYSYPYPTYITLKVQASVQMRVGSTVKATVISDVTFTLSSY